MQPIRRHFNRWQTSVRRSGDDPTQDAIRHRLAEILNHDETEAQRFRDAAVAGEVSADDYVPAFGIDAYQTAAALKDAETPGMYRKVGPSLRYVDAKLDNEFLQDWLRRPANFRPSTRMPQFFGLYDHLNSRAAAHGKAMEDVEIAGIATYLEHYSQPFEPLEDDQQMAPAAGDVERGKLLFEVGGCLACHANNDFPGQGDQGPELTGLGDKLVGEAGRKWLYGWIENPKRYHARTKMPVVPLKPLPGDEETDPIADVVEYLLASKSNWQPLEPDANVRSEHLDELALEHLTGAFYKQDAERFLQEGIPESRRSELKGAEVELLVAEELITAKEELSQEKKLLYVGRKAIGKYGCYACHDIPGFEDAKPIGTALTDWGRKDPSRLAFEHIDHYVGHGHGGHGNGHGGHGNGHAEDGDVAEDHDAAEHDSHEHALSVKEAEDPDPYFVHELHHHGRTGFIWQKLREPRSYDYEKTETKTFNEWLRMPQFTFDYQSGASLEENAQRNATAREAAITFVLGLVADPPNAEFVYHPDARQAAINDGRKVLDKFNCGGCHELESEKWDFAFPEDWDALTEPAEPTTFPFLLPHVTSEEIAASTEVNRSGQMHAQITGKPQVQSKGELDVYAYDPLDDAYLPVGELEAQEFAASDVAYKFELWNPALISGNVYMPKDSVPPIPMKQVKRRRAAHGGDLASYLLPRVLDILPPPNNEKGAEAWSWVPPSLVGEGEKVQPEWLHGFLLDPYPIRPAALLNMPKFNMSAADATKLVNYFAARDGAEFPYKFESSKRSSHLAILADQYRHAVEDLPPEQQKNFSGERFDDAMKIVTSAAGCVKCHAVNDYESKGDARAKGPNLADVYRRLRPDYVRRWIAKPSYVLPYTAMPELITYAPDNPSKGRFLRRAA